MTKSNQPTSPTSKFKLSDILRVVGILIIFLVTFLFFHFQCPNWGQYFIMYVLTGLGLSLVFAKSAEKSKAKFTIEDIEVALSGSIVVPIVLPVILLYLGSRVKSDDCSFSKTTLTVLVHDITGLQNRLFKKEGNVIMSLDGEPKSKIINEGQAFFQNLHIGDSVKLDIQSSEPYKALYPDSNYIIEPNGKVDLAIMLQGVNRVQGKVLYKEAPLPGVMVQIDNILSAVSDSTGGFVINIPDSLQKEKYEVWFTKEGFKSLSKIATPQIGESLSVPMQKQ